MLHLHPISANFHFETMKNENWIASTIGRTRTCQGAPENFVGIFLMDWSEPSFMKLFSVIFFSSRPDFIHNESPKWNSSLTDIFCVHPTSGINPQDESLGCETLWLINIARSFRVSIFTDLGVHRIWGHGSGEPIV